MERFFPDIGSPKPISGPVPSPALLRRERGVLTRWFDPFLDPQSGYALGVDGVLCDGARLHLRFSVCGACDRALYVGTDGIPVALSARGAARWIDWLTDPAVETPPLPEKHEHEDCLA